MSDLAKASLEDKYTVESGRVFLTGMQALIRRQDAHDFPMVERFRELHATGKLLGPESPAPAILRLAFGDPLPAESVVLDVRSSQELQFLGEFAEP